MDICRLGFCAICVASGCYWVATEGFNCFCTNNTVGVQNVLGIVTPGDYCYPVDATFCRRPITSTTTPSPSSVSTTVMTSSRQPSTLPPSNEGRFYESSFWILIGLILVAIGGYLLTKLGQWLMRRGENDLHHDTNNPVDGMEQEEPPNEVQPSASQRLGAALARLGDYFMDTAAWELGDRVRDALTRQRGYVGLERERDANRNEPGVRDEEQGHVGADDDGNIPDLDLLLAGGATQPQPSVSHGIEQPVVDGVKLPIVVVNNESTPRIQNNENIQQSGLRKRSKSFGSPPSSSLTLKIRTPQTITQQRSTSSPSKIPVRKCDSKIVTPVIDKDLPSRTVTRSMSKANKAPQTPRMNKSSTLRQESLEKKGSQKM